MDTFCVNLNIHYSAPQEIWDKLESVYSEMPHWADYTDGCPLWYGEDGKWIKGSVEPSGLQLSASLPQDEWSVWLQLFKTKATAALGYPIGEPEDGYTFQYWEQGEKKMEAQEYIDELNAKKRRNLIIGIVVVVILAIIILPGLFKKDGFTQADLEKALSQVPELALTQAEKDLADTILEPDTFRNELTYDLTGSTTFTLEEVADIISPVLPEGAEIIEIGVQGAIVYIDYRETDLRTILEYVDADRSGSVDQIRKGVAPLEPQPEPFVAQSQGFCQISYDIRTEETKLLSVEDFS